MEHYDILIVGAGLFGSVIAHEMTKAGRSCLVIDKRGHIGGNIYTETVAEITVHRYGPHIFHTSNKKVWDYVNKFAEFNDYIHSPVAVYNGQEYALPFNMNTFSQLWGVKTPEEALGIISEQRKKPDITEPSNLEEQALLLAGSDIYERLIKGYTQKQWGMPCNKLPPEIIKRIPLRFTYDNNYYNDRYQGIPKGGYTQIIEKMLRGSNILLGTEFSELRKSTDLSKIADKIVYTGTIDSYFGHRLGRLGYRSLRFETQVIDIDSFQGHAVVNYTNAEIPYTRITEHKYFEPAGQPTTVITKEYPQEHDGVNEPYYPINTAENLQLFKRYRALAEAETNVYFGGRLGMYAYLDMDKTIGEALLLADELKKA